MDIFKDRRLLLALGAVAALVLGVGIALLIARHDPPSKEPPPASEGGLVVQPGRVDDAKLDTARPLRCFVSGQYVGDLTLADCARKNGVATGALDVGVDETGALAATNGAGTVLTPLPPQEQVAAQPAPVTPATPSAAPGAPSTPTASAPAASGSACWRYANGEWKRLGDMSLNMCVQTLFAGQCVKSGQANYGRWGEETLRLVKGKVEVSTDDRRFRTLVEQGSNCSIPPAG
jgi:hypothetical protein